VQAFCEIVGLGYYMPIAHDYRAYGYFTFSKREVRLLKGLFHIVLVGHS
jgi:hypothetical protein